MNITNILRPNLLTFSKNLKKIIIYFFQMSVNMILSSFFFQHMLCPYLTKT